MSDPLAVLYSGYDALNATEDKSTLSETFSSMIVAAKSGEKAKRLGMKLLPQYFKFFPELGEEIFTLLLDNTEDQDVEISRTAFQTLCEITTSLPLLTRKVTLALCQLLIQGCDTDLACLGLKRSIRSDIAAAFSSLITQLKSQDQPKEPILELITDEICPVISELLHPFPETEKAIATELSGLFPDATPSEFKIYMKVLFGLKAFRDGSAGAEELLRLAQKFYSLENPVNGSEHLGRFCTLLGNANVMFQHGANGDALFRYVGEHVLPAIASFSSDDQLRLLKVVTLTCQYINGVSARALLPGLHEAIKVLIPTESPETLTPIDLTKIECLLILFHASAAKARGHLHALFGIKIITGQPSDLVDEDHTADLEKFHLRLKMAVVAARIQSEIQSERVKDLSLKKSEISILREEDEKARVLGRCLDNILQTIRIILDKKDNPAFIEGAKNIIFSWKIPALAGSKRKKEGGVTPSGKAAAVEPEVEPSEEKYVIPHKRPGAVATLKKKLKIQKQQAQQAEQQAQQQQQKQKQKQGGGKGKRGKKAKK